jgi:deferrochelatase/peroxidase EfeB
MVTTRSIPSPGSSRIRDARRSLPQAQMMGEEASEAVLIGQEDPGFAGDRYVMVQRYLNDRNGWNALTTDAQELSAGLTLILQYG